MPLLRYPHVYFVHKSIIPCYNNINSIQWVYVCKYTMVWFDSKIKGCIFIDTWRFHLQHICLPTKIFVLAMQGGCVTINLGKTAVHSVHVVTNIQCRLYYTGAYSQCKKNLMWLSIGGVQFCFTIIGFKFPLHATTYIHYIPWTDCEKLYHI